MLNANVGPTFIPAGGIQVARHVAWGLTPLVEHLPISSEAEETVNLTNGADPIVTIQAFHRCLRLNQVGPERE